MAQAQKKEKGLAKHSFRGYTPDQINELSQEKVVELFRARMRRRFSRSTFAFIQRLNTNISASMLSARRPRRTHNLENVPLQSRPTSEMPSFFLRWLETTSQSTMARALITLKSSSI